MKIILRIVAIVAGLFAMGPLAGPKAQQDTTINDADIKVLDLETPKYPALALQTSYQGTVVLRLTLTNDGKVASAMAISGHRLLTPDCLENIKKWRFQPNSRHAAVVIYNFRLSYAAQCKSSGSFFTLETPNLANITDCVVTVQP